jgi:hypothetical protein
MRVFPFLPFSSSKHNLRFQFPFLIFEKSKQ